MNISIQNFRGCSRAEIVLEKITLVAGENAAGKTSVAQAVSAALTGDPVPVSGVTKATAGCLVRSGTAAGHVEVCGAEGMVRIDYPKAAVNSEGTPPFASEFAAGLVCVLDLPSRERAEVLSRYLRAEPTREDLEARLNQIKELKPEHIDHVWRRIEEGGWDGAHAQAKEKGAKMKGQWEQITGERYGTKKADGWIPEGWSADLDGANAADLEAGLVDARAVLEGCIAAEAVDEARIEALQKDAAQVPTLEKTVAAAEEQVADLEKALAELRKVAAGLPPAEDVPSLACPHCSQPVLFERGVLVKAGATLSKKEISAREKALAEANQAVKVTEEDLKVSRRLVAELRGALSIAMKAAAELQSSACSPVEAVGDIDAARGAVALAEQRVRCFKSKIEADDRHFNIGINALILEALAPDGVRLARLKKALGEANAELAQLDAVEISGDLEASLNGTPFHLLSGSEKYRVRVALQLWMAGRDKSSAVVIDGADILVSRPLRQHLFKTLAASKIPSLVTMAFPCKQDVPDLAAKKAGVSYWIGDGGAVAQIVSGR